MTDLAVSALVRKRAELAGEIEALEARLAELRASLAHLDATILLFDPGHELAGIKPKRPPAGEALFANGELTRLIYDALRGAGGEPLDTGAITARVMAAKGLDAGDRRLVGDVRERVRKALGKKAGGALRRVALDGGAVGWRVAD